MKVTSVLSSTNLRRLRTTLDYFPSIYIKLANKMLRQSSVARNQKANKEIGNRSLILVNNMHDDVCTLLFEHIRSRDLGCRECRL